MPKMPEFEQLVLLYFLPVFFFMIKMEILNMYPYYCKSKEL